MARILVVEDDPALRKIYVSVLAKEGHSVTGAFDGKEALRLAIEDEPDLILLDMMMPSMTGIDFLREYDVLERHARVKVIAFSNTEKQEFMSEALKLGVVKYTAKYSFTPKGLAALVQETLAEAR